METFCALIRGDLAPAGNNITTTKKPNAFAYQLTGYSATWVDSGTSALALALADAKAKAPHVKNPKVIIPGYCCPDLVAAAVFAGVKPLAVDINLTDASYDLDALKNAINSDVIAIIAVNFLGIKERLADIRAMLGNTNIKLIEDNAQWFPANFQEHEFASDYVLFSFGRGKPLSLLGGGVLFSKEEIIVSELVQQAANSFLDGVKQRVKLLAFNVLLRPHLYCYLNRAPFLKLGETQYHPMTTIIAMDSFRKALFMANLSLHELRSSIAERAYDALCTTTSLQHLTSLPTARRKQLLRYPLLCADNNIRDNMLRKLSAAGLGCSPMYQRAIVEISGVDGLIEVHANIKNAQCFAHRFLTLPTHEYVSRKHIQRIKNILANS